VSDPTPTNAEIPDDLPLRTARAAALVESAAPRELAVFASRGMLVGARSMRPVADQMSSSFSVAGSVKALVKAFTSIRD
jgi:hypothetical protein